MGRLFLATKTGERAADDAWRQINASLERLGVDRVDLIQLHAVGDLEDLDRATGLRAALSRRRSGRATKGSSAAIGITGHGHEAPATHREALRRFPFDTVLSPWNYVLAGRDGYREDFLGLVEDCRRDDVGLMTIKTVSRRNWPEGHDQSYTTWYEPWDDPEHIDAAVAFALRQDGVTGIATPGDVRLLGRVVVAAERRAVDDRRRRSTRSCARAPDYSSPFERMPW